MEKFLNFIVKRRQSTARIDAMPDAAARAALERRLSALMHEQANKPAPMPQSFAPLLDPLVIVPEISVLS
jgi:hypothetical protein